MLDDCVRYVEKSFGETKTVLLIEAIARHAVLTDCMHVMPSQGFQLKLYSLAACRKYFVSIMPMWNHQCAFELGSKRVVYVCLKFELADHLHVMWYVIPTWWLCSLLAGAYIKPHTGYWNGITRLHLGVIVPGPSQILLHESSVCSLNFFRMFVLIRARFY